MSDPENNPTPVGSDFGGDSSTDESEYSERDVDDELLALIDAEMPGASAETSTNTAANPVILKVPMTIREFKCVHCDRVRGSRQIYTCQKGHMICAQCVQHPTEAGFDALPRCPHCDENAVENVEAALRSYDLQVKCQYCHREYRNCYLPDHEEKMCQQRPVRCKYRIGGCDWRGIVADLLNHEAGCTVQFLNGAELLAAIDRKLESQTPQFSFQKGLMTLLTQSTCNLVNIRLIKKTTSTTENIKLYRESSVFSAGNFQWYIKARIVERMDEPFVLEYALKLESNVEPGEEFQVFYAALGGKEQLSPNVMQHRFNVNSMESSFQRLFEFDQDFKDFEAPITFRFMVSLK